MIITNEELRFKLLPDSMFYYFKKKIPHLDPSELLVRIEETLKFLTISPYCKCNIPVTKDIDEIWHYWIIQSEEYFKLCSNIQFGEYIHHSSNDYLEYFECSFDDHTQFLSDIEMLAMYVYNFGPFENSRLEYWALPKYLISKHNWHIEDLNEWLLLNYTDKRKPSIMCKTD